MSSIHIHAYTTEVNNSQAKPEVSKAPRPRPLLGSLSGRPGGLPNLVLAPYSQTLPYDCSPIFRRSLMSKENPHARDARQKSRPGATAPNFPVTLSRIASALPTIRPEPDLSLPTSPFVVRNLSPMSGMAARHTLVATEFAFWRKERTSSGIRCQPDVPF